MAVTFAGTDSLTWDTTGGKSSGKMYGIFEWTCLCGVGMTCTPFSLSLPAQARLPGSASPMNPKLYHRSMGPSFSAGAKTRLDGVIRVEEGVL